MARFAKALPFVLFFVLFNVAELVTGDTDVLSRKLLTSEVLFNATELVTGDLNVTSSHKLLTSEGDAEVNRVGVTECDNRFIDLIQKQEVRVGGIPGFLVHISNDCFGGGNCKTIYDLHISCEWFSSTELVNPAVFKRIAYNDCLVNNGNDITPGDTISFRYFNGRRYPLQVASLKCR